MAVIVEVFDWNLEEAEEELKRALELDPLSYWALRRLGMTYNLRGLQDKAQEQLEKWLDRAVERRDPALLEINLMPWLNGLRDDQRFKTLLKKIGLEY